MRIAGYLCLCGLFLSSCAGTHFQDEQRQRDYAFREMRTEIGDLKHAMQTCRAEMQILQDRLSDQENIAKTSVRNKPNTEHLSQIAACERKLQVLEKTLDKLAAEMRGLNKHAEQTNVSLISFKEKMLDCQKELALHKQKLDGVSQLKTTLGQISQAISERPAAKTRSASYKVKPGDTLEKIAKNQGLPLPTLKRLNNLTQDRIIVGQELKLSDDE